MSPWIETELKARLAGRAVSCRPHLRPPPPAAVCGGVLLETLPDPLGGGRLPATRSTPQSRLQLIGSAAPLPRPAPCQPVSEPVVQTRPSAPVRAARHEARTTQYPEIQARPARQYRWLLQLSRAGNVNGSVISFRHRRGFGEQRRWWGFALH